MNALTYIAKETDTTVIGVHHHGKDVTRGPAGSYALMAGADFVLTVLADIETKGRISRRQVAVSKQRDAETGWSCEFELLPVQIGIDDEGLPVTSVFVETRTGSAGFAKPKSVKKSSPAQIALNKAWDQCSAITVNPNTNAQVRAAPLKEIRAEFDRHYQPTGSAEHRVDAQRQAFNRARKDFNEGSWEGEAWLWREENKSG
jgi:hypothetical protein